MLSEEAIVFHQSKITHTAEALLETMETMLVWSKGQMQNFKPTIDNVAVNDLYNQLQGFYENQLGIEFVFKNELNISLQTDANFLQTIMQNLTSNAIKALANKPNATIVWEATQSDNQIIITITDNGKGVSPEQINNLLKNDNINSQNTGLGFYIVKDLAKAIGFEIQIESGLNKYCKICLIHNI